MILRRSYILLAFAMGTSSSPVPDSYASDAPCTTYIGMIQDDPRTSTIYAATATFYNQVDCRGCVLATTTIKPHWAEPMLVPTVTLSVPDTTAVTSSICSPTADVGAPPGSGYDPCAATTCPAGSQCRTRNGRVVCTPVVPGPGGRGVGCGSTTCVSGLTCCNSSCGICTPPGQYCIMMFCSDQPISAVPEDDELSAVE